MREELIIRKQRDLIRNLKEVGQLYFKIRKGRNIATKKDAEKMGEMVAIGEKLKSELEVLESLSPAAEESRNILQRGYGAAMVFNSFESFEKHSHLLNLFIVRRDGPETLFRENPTGDGSMFVNLQGYYILPIETSVNEFADIVSKGVDNVIVDEPAIEKPITAEEVLDRNGFDFAAFEFENEHSAKNLLSAMEEYASLRTVKESLPPAAGEEKSVYEKALEIADKLVAETSPDELDAIVKQYTTDASVKESLTVEPMTAEEDSGYIYGIMADLKQYITNLLYFAHEDNEEFNRIPSRFDEWVEEQIGNIDGYFNSAPHLSPTAEKPITAEEFVIQKYGENWLNIMWFPEDVLDALEEYASLKPTVAEREVSDECEHPYAYVYRKGDYESCTKCGKELCNG